MTAMTATPPEPGFNPQQDHAMPTQPLPTMQPAFPQSFPPPAFQASAFPSSPPLPPPPDPSPEDLAGPRRPRIGPGRLIGGSIWAAITLICAVGGVAECAIGVYAGGVLCLIIAAGTGWYDYRIWRRPRPVEY
jgi:hypothetical protein